MKRKTAQKFTFFWSGPFSQWHPSAFSVGGIRFNCAEQHMMYCKAILFFDTAIGAAILSAETPREQKNLGRKISNFDEQKWELFREGIVFSGNFAKFTQCPDLKSKLLETAGTQLVEAAPNDSVWGIGLSENDPRSRDPSKWRGLNLLGKTLTRVRGAVAEDSIA